MPSVEWLGVLLWRALLGPSVLERENGADGKIGSGML